MIIHDGNLRRAGVRPAKDNAPLVVDADGMKASKHALQGLQRVAGRYG